MVKHQLQYYATQFSTTELNGVFYRTPSKLTVANWRDTTDDGFLFAWKASKFITHWKRLSDQSRNSLELMENRLLVLRDKAGPVLFQLPPHFKADADRLSSFIKLLSHKRRYAFEFRHPSWYETPPLRVLADANIALCIPTIMMHPPLGSGPPTFSMSGGMDQAAATRVTIHLAYWKNGRSR